jgi:hypothetical protein
MDLHTPAHPSSASQDDGGYGLAESSPAPVPVSAPPSSTPAEPVASSNAKPEAAEADKDKEKTEPAAAAAAPVKKKRKRRRSRKFDLPSWAVSFVVHVVILTTLAAFGFTEEGKKVIASINSAIETAPQKGVASEELTPIYADPTDNQRSQEAVGNELADKAGGGGGTGGVGTGPPSIRGAVSGVGGAVNEKSSLPGGQLAMNLPGMSLTTAAPGLDLGGSGMIAGDVMFDAKDVGESLDQIAREILRHLTQHKLTVIWLFDESSSMKDDQQAVRQKFDRITNELKIHEDAKKKSTEPLTHAIVGFGEDIHYVLEKPTADIERIGRAIDKLRVDDTGTENTLHAINEVISHYGGLVKKDHKLLIVLITDESGDDGGYIEEAHQMVLEKRVPLYVIGRQSLFGAERAHLEYRDPVTKDIYWPWIRRGPETAGVELLQWDGLHDRWEEQPSGFAPYELARLSKDSGGIYFLLPSEENMRVHQREKAYRIADLKEYMPDYKSRTAYTNERNKSELRRSLAQVIEETRWNNGPDGRIFYPRHFPVDPQAMIPAANEAGVLASVRLEMLLKIQDRLESLKKLRDREPEKRWQANYDLMLAQVVTYQIKSYEYRACLAEMIKNPPRPRVMPNPDLIVEWEINHSRERKADKSKTEKKYAEAKRLLEEVIKLHPKTPWADLAQDEINRGFGVQRGEWHHNPKYLERAKLVPKY